MLRGTNVRDTNQVKVSFALPEEHPHAADAYVAGSFNDWDPQGHPLIHRNNQTYSAVATLDKGQRYAYRYVSGDGEWFNAGDADEYEGENGILIT
ncbi:MAG: isoamylase early set domain-containing protein [Chloroflexota bacterium]